MNPVNESIKVAVHSHNLVRLKQSSEIIVISNVIQYTRFKLVTVSRLYAIHERNAVEYDSDHAFA